MPQRPVTNEPVSSSTDSPATQTPPSLPISGEVSVDARIPVQEISVDSISVNPHQPRRFFAPEDLEDLAGSIKEHGVLQPLTVTRKGDGTYELIAGERRLRASRQAGLKTVPVIVRDATDQQKLELALIENIQRQDLNAMEEARSYQALMDLFDLTQEKASARVGKTRSYVANIVRLLELPEDMQQALIDGKISKSHARTLLAEPDSSRRRALFERMLDGGMTVREAEARAGHAIPKPTGMKDPNVQAIEAQLREALGTKVDLSVAASGSGKVTVHFYSKEELKELVKKLGV